MSDTPRTDAAIVGANWHSVSGAICFARQLERENNQLRAELELARKCIEALRVANAALNELRHIEALAHNAGTSVMTTGQWLISGDSRNLATNSLAAYDQFKASK